MNSNCEVAERISTALSQAADFDKSVADEVAFHITDWLDDYQVLLGLLEGGTASEEDIYKASLKLLLHAPEHMVRAAELVTGEKPQGIFD